MELQLRANNDYGAAAIVNAFTKQILAEPSLLTTKHI